MVSWPDSSQKCQTFNKRIAVLWRKVFFIKVCHFSYWNGIFFLISKQVRFLSLEAKPGAGQRAMPSMTCSDRVSRKVSECQRREHRWLHRLLPLLNMEQMLRVRLVQPPQSLLSQASSGPERPSKYTSSGILKSYWRSASSIQMKRFLVAPQRW